MRIRLFRTAGSSAVFVSGTGSCSVFSGRAAAPPASVSASPASIRSLSVRRGFSRIFHNHHHRRDDEEDGEIVRLSRLGDENGDQEQGNDSAHSAHQVDDGVGFGAQGLRRHVRHQGDRRGAVASHSHEGYAQGFHDPGEGADVVRTGKEQHGDDGGRRPAQDEGHAPADPGMHPVGKAAEDGQHEDGEHVVDGHDAAGNGVADLKGVFQDQRNQAVIQLPEGADGQKGKADQDGPSGIQFHSEETPFLRFSLL